jgi:TolB-like protein/Tfp pilus assembly protein PilF
MRGFFRELKHRQVYRVALAYGVVASGLVQIGGTILPIFHVAEWVQQSFVVLIAIGFPFALVLAWAFDITSSGIERAPSVTGLHVTSRRQVWVLALVGTAIAGFCLAGYWFWHPWRPRVSSLTKSEISEKGIAVLPFQNLSADKENAFFTDGVQDQILTDLAKVADLKVIGQTSVQQYKGDSAHDRQKIGEQLGVAYLLEGSVQRAGHRLRISAHLFDSRTDQQLWAETYDRELADVFAIQSEIAQTIVGQLQATISPQEKALIEERPTWNLAAYDLYLRATELVDSYTNAPDPKVTLLEAIDLLDKATTHDPGFVLAYAYTARAHDLLYFLDLDPTPERAVRGQIAAETALRLAPNSAEAHLAMADHYLRCRRDYRQADKELAVAQPSLPNSVAFFTLSGYLRRREGKWEEGTRDFIRAVELDPRNINASNLLADTYVLLRQFEEAMAVADRSVAAGLDLPITHLRGELVRFAQTGDPEVLRRALAQAPADMDIGGGETPIRILVALIRHDYAEAERVLAASPRETFQDTDFSFYYPREWYEAIIARASGNQGKTKEQFGAARKIIEARLTNKPEDPRTLAVLAQVDANLGEKDHAIAEARRAVELMPLSRDAYDGVLVLQGLAQVYTWTGENDQALQLLQRLMKLPGYLSYGYLRADPAWDPLRKDPKFNEFVSSLAPKNPSLSPKPRR